MVILNCFFFLTFFVSRTCLNEFLSLLDVAWVNKVFLVFFVVVVVAVDFSVVFSTCAIGTGNTVFFVKHKSRAKMIVKSPLLYLSYSRNEHLFFICRIEKLLS